MELTAGTPNYSLPEAAMFTRLSLSTVRYWTRGREGTPPVINVAGSMMSFVNLVELHIVGMFRGVHRVPLQRIRRAITQMASRFPNDPHPLMNQRFWTDGHDIVDADLVSLVDPGQRSLPLLFERYAQRVEWKDGHQPLRFFPWTVNNVREASPDNLRKSVMVDPRVSFGRSVITDTRVTTRAIKDLWDIGTDLKVIASEFDVTDVEAQDAIRLEETSSSVRRAG